MTREFWDSRAPLGDNAGTQDAIAKELALRELRPYLAPAQTILDIGCGTGQTAARLLAWEPTLQIIGLDFSAAMIAVARTRRLRADFSEWDLLSPLPIPTFPDGGADLVITERVLINMPTWLLQVAVFERIMAALKPGGRYLMIENSLNSLDTINVGRRRHQLPPITVPSHNLYLREGDFGSFKSIATLEAIRPFSGCYYFLSRIVNARIAADLDEAPDYQSPINRLALELPTTSFSAYAQGKLWIWRKDL